MPAVPRRPGPRPSTRPLRSGLVRGLHSDQGKGGGEGYGAAVRGAAPPGEGPGRAGARPGDGPAAATGAREAGRLSIPRQESLPAGWPRFVFCLVEAFFLFFWGFVVFLIEGVYGPGVPPLQHPAQARTTEDAGSQWSPPRSFPPAQRARQDQHRSCGGVSAGGGGTAACPRLPEQTAPGSSPHPPRVPCVPCLTALVPAAENEDGFLFPRAHPRRGDLPRLGGFPVPLARRGVPGAQLLRPARWSRGLGKGGEATTDVAVAPWNPDLSVISESLSSTIKHYHYHYCY